MRVLAIVLAYLACTGHGRGVFMTNQGPAYQAGSGRAGASDQKKTLASLLRERGGMGGFDDGKVWQSLGETESFRERHTRRPKAGAFGDVGGGRVRSPPMSSYRSEFDDARGGYADSLPTSSYRGSLPATRDASEVEDLDDSMDEPADIGMRQAAGAAYGTRRLPRESTLPMKTSRPVGAYRTRRAVVEDEDLDDFLGPYGGKYSDIGRRQTSGRGAVYGTRRLPRVSVGQVRSGISEVGDTEDFRERHIRRPKTGAFGDVRVGRTAASDAFGTEDFRDSTVRIAKSTPGGYVEDADYFTY